jgi:hypothetical protein
MELALMLELELGDLWSYWGPEVRESLMLSAVQVAMLVLMSAAKSVPASALE